MSVGSTGNNLELQPLLVLHGRDFKTLDMNKVEEYTALEHASSRALKMFSEVRGIDPLEKNLFLSKRNIFIYKTVPSCSTINTSELLS